MGKFNISTAQPGQVSEVDQSIIETPVEQKQEATPQAQGSAFEALISGKEASADAAIQEINQDIQATGSEESAEFQQQREAEKVAPLSDRLHAAPELGSKWVLDSSDTGSKATGLQDLVSRATNMKQEVDSGKLTAGWGIGAATTPEGKSIASIAIKEGPDAAAQALDLSKPHSPAAILGKIGASFTGAGTAKTSIHPKFIPTLSAVTENYFNNAQDATVAGVPKEVKDAFTGESTGDLVRPEEDYQIEKAQGNDRLGKDINREFQRTLAAEQGRSTDDYQDIGYEDATVLGDLAKELFHRANPDLIKRDIDTRGRVVFRMTAQGVSAFEASRGARKRLFPTVQTRPSKTVLPKGELIGEGKKLKRTVTKKAGDLGKIALINQAKENLHTVPNVVDPRRLKVLLATALPAILLAHRNPSALKEGQVGSTWGDMAGIGRKQTDKFIGAKVISDRSEAKRQAQAEKDGEPFYPATPYNVESNIKLMSESLAQSVRASVLEKDGANYLTYATQPFTGRVFPQQTYFDPTTSKLVRFVTRNATPSIARKGGRVEANLKQMYSMMFIKEASEALPAERVKFLETQGPKLYGWGATIEAALDSQITDAYVEQVTQAISNNISPNDPNFPQLTELKLPDEITNYLNSKDEDGLSVLEGLIDYKHFVDAMKAGRPHASYFNAYMDGKTNGIANNGIQLGNEKIAKYTGVIRENGKRLLDDDVDIRDQLGNIIHERARDNGFEGMDKLDNPAAVQNVISVIGRIRPLQKDITMTYGYGKELQRFYGDIETAVEEYRVKNPDISSINKALPSGKTFNDVYDKALDQYDGKEDALLKVIHKEYMQGLTEVMSEDSAASRALLRANSVMYALMDDVFSIPGPSGFNLNIAGTQILEGDQEKAIQYKPTQTSKSDPKTVTAYLYDKKDTSAAERHGIPGQHAYGRSLTTPVQSLDASTVAQTVTGKSWDKLKHASNGNPYLHTIYDAFKVDANGYDTVLEEVNKNWLNTSFDWSYLEETRDAYKRDHAAFISKLNKLPGDQILTKKDNHGINMMEWLFSVNPLSGNLNLTNRIRKTTYDSNETPLQTKQRVDKQTQRISEIMTKLGYRAGSGQATVEQYRTFVDYMHKNIYDLHAKNSQFTAYINRKKDALRKKIDPKTVYQYYAH